MWEKKKKKKKERFSHLSLSWLASLGRLLQRQIRCRQVLARRIEVWLFYLWLSVCTILLYFALSTTLHGVYLVQRNFSGCIGELHNCVIYVLPNGQSHKDWKCVSFYKHNMDFLKKLKQRPRNCTSKHISTVSILRNRSVCKRKEEIALYLC